jgi:hypothetical protein
MLQKKMAYYCKALSGKTLFSALRGTYTVTLNELKAMLKDSTMVGESTTPQAMKQVYSGGRFPRGLEAQTTEQQ